MWLHKAIKEIPEVWFLGSLMSCILMSKRHLVPVSIPISLFTALGFMLCHVMFIFLVLCLVFCTNSCLEIAALYLQLEQCIPKGGRGNGEGFHIADFVLTVMVSDGGGTKYSPAPWLIVHTDLSELPGGGVIHVSMGVRD